MEATEEAAPLSLGLLFFCQAPFGLWARLSAGGGGCSLPLVVLSLFGAFHEALCLASL